MMMHSIAGDVPSVEHNVVARLKSVAARCGDRPALVIDSAEQGRRSITFGELWDAVDRVSVGLRQRGLQPGQRAIVMVPMSIDLYIVLLAVLKVGAAAVFVDPWIGLRQVAAFAVFAEPSAFIGIGKSHWLRQLERRLRAIKLSVTTGRRFLAVPARHTLAELLTERGDGLVEPVRADDSGLITFTSGSSGVPKGANRTHGFLIAQHEALKGEFPYDAADVDMPMFPVFALNNLATGITSIVPDIDFRRVADCNGARLLEQINRDQVTTCTASPPFFDRLAAACSEVNAKTFRPRRLLTGGAPVSDDQLRLWRETWPDARIEVVYGSTEAEPVAHIEADERLQRTQQAGVAAGYLLGRPADCIAWRVVRITKGPIRLDSDGWQSWLVPAGMPGELVVTGAHVGKDYFRNEAATTENKIIDAAGAVWHRMGDTVYADDSGMLWIVGRVHSTIVRNGEFIHPQQLERIARGNETTILHLATVGIPDQKMGEAVAVVVQLPAIDAANSPDDLQALTERIRLRLAERNLPLDRLLLTRQALPVDPRHNSKIDYTSLRAQLLAGKLNAIFHQTNSADS